jgi:hypothetical protein
VLVIAPYAVSVPVALMVAERLEAATGAGLVALALAPGSFLAPGLVSAAGGRRGDMAGALLLGTVIMSFALVVTRPAASTVALTAAQAFAVASLAASALPQVRDRVLAALRWAGYLAGLVVILLAIAGGPPIDPVTVIVALAATLVTLVVAGAIAITLRRDVFSAVAAAGTRDPIVAVALAWATGGSGATAVPIVSAAILGILAAALVLRRR